jgi:hypothetical protein
MKMNEDLKQPDTQVIKIADVLRAKPAPAACCGRCSKAEGESNGACDHGQHEANISH